MGYKPIQKKKFIKWLRKKGLVYKRTEGGHEIWDYPDTSTIKLLRPVVIRTSDKDIPGVHIHTNLFTLDVLYKDFEKEIQRI